MNKQANFDFMLKTVRMFAQSQGFYGRVLRDLKALSDSEMNDFINKLPDFKNDPLKVVYYFEQ
jgi:hypothetical protein